MPYFPPGGWDPWPLAPVPHLHHPPTIHVFQAIRAAVVVSAPAAWPRVCRAHRRTGSRAASSWESLHPLSGRSHSWNERWGAGCRVPLGFSLRSWVHSASAVVHLPRPGTVSPAEAPGQVSAPVRAAWALRCPLTLTQLTSFHWTRALPFQGGLFSGNWEDVKMLHF